MAARTVAGITLDQAAKQLGTTRPALLKHLRSIGAIYQENTLPQTRYIKAGYFVVETKQYRNDHGINRQYTKTLITGTGMSWIAEIINEIRSTAA